MELGADMIGRDECAADCLTAVTSPDMLNTHVGIFLSLMQDFQIGLSDLNWICLCPTTLLLCVCVCSVELAGIV